MSDNFGVLCFGIVVICSLLCGHIGMQNVNIGIVLGYLWVVVDMWIVALLCDFCKSCHAGVCSLWLSTLDAANFTFYVRMCYVLVMVSMFAHCLRCFPIDWELSQPFGQIAHMLAPKGVMYYQSLINCTWLCIGNGETQSKRKKNWNRKGRWEGRGGDKRKEEKKRGEKTKGENERVKNTSRGIFEKETEYDPQKYMSQNNRDQEKCKCKVEWSIYFLCPLSISGINPSIWASGQSIDQSHKLDLLITVPLETWNTLVIT